MAHKMKVLIVVGTRPEAVKMAPIIREFIQTDFIDLKICTTAQHRELLDPILQDFMIVPDFDLDLMTPRQTLNKLTCSIIDGIAKILQSDNFDWVFVHGDTTTTFASAIAAFHENVKVAHVEAGLRTGDKKAPWPEEVNRNLVSKIADLHFAPTQLAKNNLISENVDPKTIHVTGNSVIDALFWALECTKKHANTAGGILEHFAFHNSKKKLILVTGHRRENFGQRFRNMLMAIKEIAEREDVQIVFPVHLNPSVSSAVQQILGQCANIKLIPPVDYFTFVQLMQMSYLIITDSGGIQEEAPSLNVPVLVTRETTERPEALDAGTIKLVGTSQKTIFEAANRLLDNHVAYDEMANSMNPYGNGDTSKQIVNILSKITSHE